MLKNIYDLSSRTRRKIIKRLKLNCFECGWDKADSDIHHIIERSDGGSDNHDNLTILCPNCHRLAHNKILTTFVTLEEKIGDDWLLHYNEKNKSTNNRINGLKGQQASLKTRQENAKKKALSLISDIKKSDIDFKQRGWKARVSERFSIHRQHVHKLFLKYDPEFLKECY